MHAGITATITATTVQQRIEQVHVHMQQHRMNMRLAVVWTRPERRQIHWHAVISVPVHEYRAVILDRSCFTALQPLMA
jgi:hypothetical protein